MRRETARALVAVVATSAVAGGLYAGAAHAGSGQDQLDGVRQATAPFHAVSVAEKAGYHDPGLPCFDDKATGEGMGFHLVNGALLNDGGKLDPDHPEALVYEMHQGMMRLVAVEYLVKMSDAPTPPKLFGQQMIPNTSLGLWTLHAWIWRDNPVSLFASYNANVALCPTH
jgi:hypothetical protein